MSSACILPQMIIADMSYRYGHGALGSIETHQYSVTSHRRSLRGGLATEEGHKERVHAYGGIPGVFFSYGKGLWWPSCEPQLIHRRYFAHESYQQRGADEEPFGIPRRRLCRHWRYPYSCCCYRSGLLRRRTTGQEEERSIALAFIFNLISIMFPISKISYKTMAGWCHSIRVSRLLCRLQNLIHIAL